MRMMMITAITIEAKESGQSIKRKYRGGRAREKWNLLLCKLISKKGTRMLHIKQWQYYYDFIIHNQLGNAEYFGIY